MEEVQTRKFGYLAWILFAVAILNFFNTGAPRFYMGIAMCVAVIALLLTSEGWRSLEGLKKTTFFTLLIFTFIYGLNVYRFQFVDFSHFLMYALSPALFYIAGYYLATRSSDNRYKYLVNFAIITSTVVFGFICVFYTISVNGTILDPYSNSRSIIDFWTGNILNATLIGVYISLGVGILAVLFIRAESRFASIIKMILLAIFVVCVYCVYFLANRTSIVIGIATPIITLIIIYNKSKELIRVIFWVALFLFALYLSYGANLFGMKTTIINSPLALRFASSSVENDLRFGIWREAGAGLIAYPEGGKATLLDGSAAHNLWLDVGWDAGVIAFIFAVIFTISSIIDFIHSIRQREIPVLLRTIIISMLISFLLASAVEPIIEGVFTYFLSFCFFVAFVSGMRFKRESADNLKVDSQS